MLFVKPSTDKSPFFVIIADSKIYSIVDIYVVNQTAN